MKIKVQKVAYLWIIVIVIIMNYIKESKTIKKISNEARDLLHGLLNKNPDKRLTIEEILNHHGSNSKKRISIKINN